MGSPLHVNDFEELNLRMAQISPYFLKKDYLEQSHSIQIQETDSKIFNFNNFKFQKL